MSRLRIPPVPLLLLLLGLVSARAQAQQATDINQYVNEMSYDPNQLLSVKDPGSSWSLPAPRENGRDGVIVCTNKQQGLEQSLDEVTSRGP